MKIQPHIGIGRLFFSAMAVVSGLLWADPVDDLMTQLNDPDPMVRCLAIEQLGQLKDKRAVEPLLALIASENKAEPKARASQSPSAKANDSAVQKIEAAKRACGSGHKHPEPTLAAPPAALKQLVGDLRKMTGFMEKEKAVEALGATKDKRAVDPLLGVLNEKDFGQLHVKAIEALGLIGDPKAVPALLNYLPGGASQNSNPMKAKAAASALANIGDPRAAEPLYKAIETDPFLQQDGVKCLRELGGPESIKFLNRLTKAKNEFVRREAKLALETMGRFHGLDPLVALLKDTDPQVRAMAADILLDSSDPTVKIAIKEVLDSLEEEDRIAIERKMTSETTGTAMETGNAPAMQTNVKVTAIEALGEIRDPRAVRPLLAALHDPDPAICKAAGKALAGYPGKAVIRPIELSLDNPDKTIVTQAIGDLGWIGSDYAVELLAKQLNNPFVNTEAIEALGRSDNPKAIPYLEQAMQSPFTEKAALEAVCQIHHPDALKTLCSGLSSPNFVTRQKAVEALAKFNDPAVIEPLIELFKKNDHTVHKQVTEILKRYPDRRIDAAFAESLGDPSQKETLLVLLKERRWQPQTTREKVLYYSAAGDWDRCAQLGPEGADLLLEELKRNPSDGVAAALNKMDEKRAYPVMLDLVRQWRGSAELLAGAEKTGWKPATLEEQWIAASIKQDKAALKKLWSDPAGKLVFTKALNSENLSAVMTVMRLAVGMGLEEMVQPIIARFHAVSSETAAVSICNLFLGSGNKNLYAAAESWAVSKGYEIHKFSLPAGANWGTW